VSGGKKGVSGGKRGVNGNFAQFEKSKKAIKLQSESISTDRDVPARVRSLHAGPEPPRISHYVSAGRPRENMEAQKEATNTKHEARARIGRTSCRFRNRIHNADHQTISDNEYQELHMQPVIDDLLKMSLISYIDRVHPAERRRRRSFDFSILR
jgi:hypothetical protein